MQVYYLYPLNKKIMKKIIAGIAFTMFIAFGAQAQDSTMNTKKHHRKGHHGSGYSKLDLTEAQKEQMKLVQAEYRNQMDELKKNDKITVAEAKEKRAAIARNHRNKVDNILTEKQKNQLNESRKNMHTKRGDRKGKESATAKLNLTEAQSAKMKTLNEGFRSKAKEIKENNTLDSTARKERLMTLRKEHQQEISSILTPEQAAKMKELRSSRKIRTR